MSPHCCVVQAGGAVNTKQAGGGVGGTTAAMLGTQAHFCSLSWRQPCLICASTVVLTGASSVRARRQQPPEQLPGRMLAAHAPR